MKHLILGGVKSGKSCFAENAVRDYLTKHELKDDAVCYIATAQALDDGMKVRINKHKQQRPTNWHVIEEPLHLAQALNQAGLQFSIILVDCLTLWLTNLLMKEDPGLLEKSISDLVFALKQSSVEILLVSNETNMGIMPLGKLTRDYCDKAGELHQVLAAECDKVSLIVAGLPLSLKSPVEQE